MFWNIDGKNGWKEWYEKDELNKDSLYQKDVIFFSETMSLQPFPSFRNMNFTCSEAQRTNGRPSGGLELYYPAAEKGKVLSTSHNHIVLQLSNVYVIGIYYSPALDFDEKVTDLLVALSQCNKFELPIILGGDFNVHEGEPDFDNLKAILSNFNLSLVSNPGIYTYVGPQGSSTPDHVFCSDAVEILSLEVHSRTESFHRPHILKIKIPADKPPEFTPKFLDIDRQNLIELKLISPNLSDNELITRTNNILNSCKVLRTPKTKNEHTHEIRILRNEVREAFQLFQRYNTQFFKDFYLKCRSEFRRAVMLNRKRVQDTQICTLLERTQEIGLRALYNTARRSPSSSSSSQVPLRAWYDYYSDLYQSLDEPVFIGIPTAPTEKASKLLDPISETEVFNCLNHQSSKALGFSDISPFNLKALAVELTPLLTRIFNHILIDRTQFPLQWLSTILFFLHKKGSFKDPGNYRSLAIEDPFLKAFTTILCSRLTDFSESNGLLPPFQFGFRRNMSTSSATNILKKCVENSFTNRKKVFACFVDYKKAFDLVNRQKLSTKLQHLGIPPEFCRIIFDLLSGLQLRARSNCSISPPFDSYNGVPQGDPLSPLLFSLYTADIPNCLSHQGVFLNNGIEIRYLLYADDLVLITNSPEQLQVALNQLEMYTRQSDLVVNVNKTKCLTFFKGSYRPIDFRFNNQPLQNVNSFTYLGVVFTTRLSAHKHVEHIISKCNTRIGFLFAKVPIKKLPLDVVLQIFNIYILPITSYCVSTWLPMLKSATARMKVNSMFTKFLKRYLGVPYGTRNAITHFLTGTIPLCSALESKAQSLHWKVNYPRELEGTVFEPPLFNMEYNLLEEIPTHFWASEVISNGLPTNPEARRALMYDTIDLYHRHICIFGDMVGHPEGFCRCRFCGDPLQERYHYRNCSILSSLTPCSRMRTLGLL